MCWAGAGYSASTTQLRPGMRKSAHEVPDRMRVSRRRTPVCRRRIRVDAGCASQLVAERRLCKAERGSVRGPIPVGRRRWTESDQMTVCRSGWTGYDRRGLSSTQHHLGRRISRRRSSMAWSTVSNAADRSSSVNMAMSPLSRSKYRIGTYSIST